MKPDIIYIEDDDQCPYFYHADEEDRPVDAIKYVRADLQKERDELKRKYNHLLTECYGTTMNACECGLGKRPAYERCIKCELKALQAENERLRAEVNEMSGTYTSKQSVIDDAERYRLLRQIDKGPSWDDLLSLPRGTITCTEDIDAAADAAKGQGDE